MKLLKEIKNKQGFTLFKRWGILNFYFFRIDMHEFFLPEDSDSIFDRDHFLHNHPRAFISYIAKGGYTEDYKSDKNAELKNVERVEKSFNFIGLKCFHRIKRLRSKYCKTYVLSTRNIKNWGYLDDSGSELKIISNKEYRRLKASGFYKKTS